MSTIISCSTLDEIFTLIQRLSTELLKENFLLAGPCGIGKTALGKRLSERGGLHFIDHDEMKGKINRYPFPCSLANLDLDDCLRESLLIEGNPDAFVFAVGGDSLFRVGADNDERLAELVRVKAKYKLVVLVLLADRNILECRYLQVAGRTKNSFPGIWLNWENTEKSYWEKCADCMVDTSSLIL